jgi:hypothetical protein
MVNKLPFRRDVQSSPERAQIASHLSHTIARHVVREMPQ